MSFQWTTLVLCNLTLMTMAFNLSVQVSHERNLLWIQREQGTELSRIFSISGDPDVWIQTKSATSRKITAPDKKWRFTSLTFDYRNQTIYWSDVGSKRIQALALNGSRKPVTIYSGMSAQVESISMDWVSGNLYWVDAMYNWIMMSAVRRTSQFERVIINSGLDEPSSVAVDANNRALFWADQGVVPKIERSDLSGQNRITIVSSNINKPRDLTIDPADGRVIWIDTDTVVSMTVDGNDRRVIFRKPGSQFFAVAVYKESMFITEQTEGKLIVFNKNTSKLLVSFDLDNATPYDVIMYDESSQPYHRSPCLDEQCSQMCVEAALDSVTCLCSHGYHLLEDARTCKKIGDIYSPEIVYSIGTAICHYPGNIADMDLSRLKMDHQCILDNSKSITALAFDVTNSTLFFYERDIKTLFQFDLRDISKTPISLLQINGQIESMSYDWAARNLYWTNSDMSAIQACSVDKLTIVDIIEGLQNPTALAIDAVNRKMYWSDIGASPRIESCDLDGSNRHVIISHDIVAPNHIAIDYVSYRLYWSDSKRGTIEWASFDGRMRKVVITQSASVHGLAIFQDYLMWTEQGERNGLHTAVKESGERVRGIVHPGVGMTSQVIAYAASVQPAVKEQPCYTSNHCEHICLHLNGRTSSICRCSQGYTLANDGFNCSLDLSMDSFLLFSDTFQKQIYKVDISTQAYSSLNLVNVENPVGLALDPVTDKVYWSDVELRVLMRSNLDGNNAEIVLSLAAESIPDGIAMDPLSGLLYYTDAGSKRIGVLNTAHSYHRLLITSDLNNPRGIAVDYINGMIYWTDWGKGSRIETSLADGSQRRTLLYTGTSSWPNGITIDIQNKKLYWCDAKADKIEGCSIDGMECHTVLTSKDTHFFALVYSRNALYYTDWTKRSIWKFDLSSKGNKVYSISKPVFSRANGIAVYNKEEFAQYKRIGNRCMTGNGGCSHICFPFLQQQLCACPDGSVLQDGTCISATTVPANHAYVLSGDKAGVSLPTPANRTVTSPPPVESGNVSELTTPVAVSQTQLLSASSVEKSTLGYMDELGQGRLFRLLSNAGDDNSTTTHENVNPIDDSDEWQSQTLHIFSAHQPTTPHVRNISQALRKKTNMADLTEVMSTERQKTEQTVIKPTATFVHGNVTIPVSAVTKRVQSTEPILTKILKSTESDADMAFISPMRKITPASTEKPNQTSSVSYNQEYVTTENANRSQQNQYYSYTTFKHMDRSSLKTYISKSNTLTTASISKNWQHNELSRDTNTVSTTPQHRVHIIEETSYNISSILSEGMGKHIAGVLGMFGGGFLLLSLIVTCIVIVFRKMIKSKDSAMATNYVTPSNVSTCSDSYELALSRTSTYARTVSPYAAHKYSAMNELFSEGSGSGHDNLGYSADSCSDFSSDSTKVSNAAPLMTTFKGVRGISHA